MFVVAGSAQINLNNVEEFDFVAQSNGLIQLQVRFVSGYTKVLCEGTSERCTKYLTSILLSKNIQESRQRNR